MRTLFALFLPLTFCAALSGAPAAAQEPSARTEAELAALREARARWDALTEEERDLLRARFEKFRQFDEPRRKELRERADRFKEIGRHLRKHGLPPELERELDNLPPPEQRERMHRWLGERFEERGRRIRGKMPEHMIERLERAPPGRRGALAEGFRREWRGEHSEQLLDKLARGGHLPPEQAEALRALPVEERIGTLLDLRREKITADIARRGLPPGITVEQWAQWQGLPTPEFFERFHRAVGPPPGPPGADTERARTWLEIRRLMKDRSELDEFDRLRVLDLLTGMEDVRAERLEELRALHGTEFYRAVRELGREQLEERMGRPLPPRPLEDLRRPGPRNRRDGPERPRRRDGRPSRDLREQQ